MTGYGEDLAYVNDAGFTGLADTAAWRLLELLSALRAVGFRARALRGYAGERFAPGHTVLLGRRP